MILPLILVTFGILVGAHFFRKAMTLRCKDPAESFFNTEFTIIDFFTGSILGGLSLGILPILVYLMNNRKPQKDPWPHD